MLCQFLLYSKVTQSYICIHFFSSIIFHHGLSQETGYSFLCYGVGLQTLFSSKDLVILFLVLDTSPSHLTVPCFHNLL